MRLLVIVVQLVLVHDDVDAAVLGHPHCTLGHLAPNEFGSALVLRLLLRELRDLLLELPDVLRLLIELDALVLVVDLRELLHLELLAHIGLRSSPLGTGLQEVSPVTFDGCTSTTR